MRCGSQGRRDIFSEGNRFKTPETKINVGKSCKININIISIIKAITETITKHTYHATILNFISSTKITVIITHIGHIIFILFQIFYNILGAVKILLTHTGAVS